jgi:hypothetical protein
MSDLVVTCPKGFWLEWIAEGDPAGTPWSGTEWGWYMGGRRPDIAPGDRLYIVAWGKLRGYAPVTRLMQRCRDTRLVSDVLRGYADVRDIGAAMPVVPSSLLNDSWCICREGNAEAVTIAEVIPGFRGWRRRWWPREHEVPFADWQTFGVPQRRAA